ncbi:hypothetical protein [Streptomyces sp. NPDC054940]
MNDRAEQLKAPCDRLLTGAQAVTRPVDIHTNRTGGPMSEHVPDAKLIIEHLAQLVGADGQGWVVACNLGYRSERIPALSAAYQHKEQYLDHPPLHERERLGKRHAGEIVAAHSGAG